MRKFAAGIAGMQAGDSDQFPYGVHLAEESDWYSWSNFAMQALAQAGERFNDPKLIESALVEADQFVPYLQKINFAHHFNLFEVRQNEAIYIPESGLAKDHIRSRNYVVPTLTAAATVEALMIILKVEANSDSRKEFYAEMETVFSGKP